MLSQVEPTLGKATNLLECLSHSDEVRAEYEARERAIRDYNMYINDAREEGIEKGIEIGEQRGIKIGEQIGEQKGIQETIKKLLKAGMNSNQLAPMLGLSEQQIQELSTQ